MKTILKFAKPFVFAMLFSVLFLFARVWTDLTLPNLMSDIVNTGLQMGGITEATPEKISRNGMVLVTSFMTPSEENTFLRGYTLTGDIHERLEPASEEAGRIYGRAASAAVQFFVGIAQQNSGNLVGSEEAEGYESVRVEDFYAFLPRLSEMPRETLVSYAVYDEDAATLSQQHQVGVLFTREFYKELGMDVDSLQYGYISRAGMVMLGYTLLSVVAAVLNGLFSSRVGAGFSRDLRRAIFEKVESFSSKEFDKFSTASLLTRTTNDVTQLQGLVTMGLRMLCYAPIMGVGGVVMALQKSTTLSWIIAASVSILIVVVIVLFRTVVPKFTKMQEQTDKVNLIARENLSGMMVIRAFGNERHEEDRFNAANMEMSLTNQSIQKTVAFVMPFMTILMNVVMAAIVWIGAKAISESEMQVGDMMAFMQYAMQIIMSFLMISMMFIMLPRAAVSGKRIAEVLNSENLIKDPKPTEAAVLEGSKKGREIAFHGVTFRYGRSKDPVLNDISFTARSGETTAIIGATGSGKTTLVNLIPRFYDVTQGSVTIDGIDVRDIPMDRLRAEIGYIPQKGLLFGGTIKENIQYGNEDAGEKEILDALKTAQASAFVEEYEDGMMHEVSQGGNNVSGGQRQRLAIARALVKKASVYIFDDSFSALDFQTDAALRKALAAEITDAAVIIVAQRVSTIMSADQIIVLEDGGTVGMGTHKELLKTCETYREIAESQMAKEELYNDAK